MNIAVTYERGQIFQHFGHCQQFKVYEVAGNQILSSMSSSAAALAAAPAPR